MPGLAPFESNNQKMSTFTLDDSGAFTDILVEKGYQTAKRWRKENPIYHIEVQTTVGGLESSFSMNASKLEMVGAHTLRSFTFS